MKAWQKNIASSVEQLKQKTSAEVENLKQKTSVEVEILKQKTGIEVSHLKHKATFEAFKHKASFDNLKHKASVRQKTSVENFRQKASMENFRQKASMENFRQKTSLDNFRKKPNPSPDDFAMPSKGSLTGGGNGFMQFANRLNKTSFPDSNRPRSPRNSGQSQMIISGPVELTHTTNVLSYNAPDVNGVRDSLPPSAGTVSSRFESEYDPSIAASSLASSPPTSPDIPRALSPKVAHVSRTCYPVTDLSYTPSRPTPMPMVPKRSPTHTMRQDTGSAEFLVQPRRPADGYQQQVEATRYRSDPSRHRDFAPHTSSSRHDVLSSTSLVKQQPSSPLSRYSDSSTSTARSSFQSTPMASKTSSRVEMKPNSFDLELGKVTELAEEYHGQNDWGTDRLSKEDKDMFERGLHKFNAMDYALEIESILDDYLAEDYGHASPPAVHSPSSPVPMAASGMAPWM